jgi:hypothetical protein
MSKNRLRPPSIPPPTASRRSVSAKPRAVQTPREDALGFSVQASAPRRKRGRRRRPGAAPNGRSAAREPCPTGLAPRRAVPSWSGGPAAQCDRVAPVFSPCDPGGPGLLTCRSISACASITYRYLCAPCQSYRSGTPAPAKRRSTKGAAHLVVFPARRTRHPARHKGRSRPKPDGYYSTGFAASRQVPAAPGQNCRQRQVPIKQGRDGQRPKPTAPKPRRPRSECRRRAGRAPAPRGYQRRSQRSGRRPWGHRRRERRHRTAGRRA